MLPEGASWHIDLLRQAATATDKRPAIIASGLRSRLAECLELRHVARTHYSFDLDWRLLRVHVEALPGLIADFATSIREFLDRIELRSP